MEYFIPLFLGALASQLQQNKFKKLGPFWQFLIAFGGCFVVSLVLTGLDFYTRGTFRADQFLAILGVSFLASQGYYNLYFKNLLKDESK
jgi:hypothetical protein